MSQLLVEEGGLQLQLQLLHLLIIITSARKLLSSIATEVAVSDDNYDYDNGVSVDVFYSLIRTYLLMAFYFL